MLYQVLEELFDRRLRKKGLWHTSMFRREWWLFPLAGGCLLLGLKRSVLLAVFISFMVGILLMQIPDREARASVRGLCVLLTLFGFAYVIACYYGIMDWLELIGVNTRTRAHFFGQLRAYYEMSVGYFGRGAGFISRMMQEGSLVAASNGYLPNDIHNEFLRQYIELGFFGYLIWMILYLNYKIEFFFHGLNTENDRFHGILVMCFIVANYMTFMTENSLYGFKLIMVSSLLMMAYHFEDYCGLEAESRYG